jgi:uncharacterized protein
VSVARDWRLVVVGLIGGTLSGLTGVGGGVILVPLLVLWLHWGQKAAQSASLTAIIPIALVGAITYASDGAVDWHLGIALAAGAVVGARVGAGLLARLPERTLKGAFGVLLLVAAAASVLK